MRTQPLTAPIIDRLLCWFNERYLNPSYPTKKKIEAMDKLFPILSDLTPLKENNEAKSIWVCIPRGGIENYTSYKDLKNLGEVANKKEYLERWHEDYPQEMYWYRLTILEGRNKTGEIDFRAVVFGEKMIIHADMRKESESEDWKDEAVEELCDLISVCAKESMEKLRAGKYNHELAE